MVKVAFICNIVNVTITSVTFDLNSWKDRKRRVDLIKTDRSPSDGASISVNFLS